MVNSASPWGTEHILMRSRVRCQFCLFSYSRTYPKPLVPSRINLQALVRPSQEPSPLPLPPHPASPDPSPRTVHLTCQIPRTPMCLLPTSTLITPDSPQPHTRLLWHLPKQFPFLHSGSPSMESPDFSSDQGMRLLKTLNHLRFLHRKFYPRLQGLSRSGPTSFSRHLSPSTHLCRLLPRGPAFRFSDAPNSLLHEGLRNTH